MALEDRHCGSILYYATCECKRAQLYCESIHVHVERNLCCSAYRVPGGISPGGEWGGILPRPSAGGWNFRYPRFRAEVELLTSPNLYSRISFGILLVIGEKLCWNIPRNIGSHGRQIYILVASNTCTERFRAVWEAPQHISEDFWVIWGHFLRANATPV